MTAFLAEMLLVWKTITLPTDTVMFAERISHGQHLFKRICKVISSPSTLTIMRKHTLNGTHGDIYTPGDYSAQRLTGKKTVVIKRGFLLPVD